MNIEELKYLNHKALMIELSELTKGCVLTWNKVGEGVYYAKIGTNATYEFFVSTSRDDIFSLTRSGRNYSLDIKKNGKYYKFYNSVTSSGIEELFREVENYSIDRLLNKRRKLANFVADLIDCRHIFYEFPDGGILGGGAAPEALPLWILRTAPASTWSSITYGNGLFVAVATTSNPVGIITSPDGITWTARTVPQPNAWVGVTFGNGLFVAVATNGEKRIMTSPDGITWTARNAPAQNQWSSVTYGNGLFVAVATSLLGEGAPFDRVMTSADGITWTIRGASEASEWFDVCFGNGLFVAVGYAVFDGTAFLRIMTSPNGITWTTRTSIASSRCLPGPNATIICAPEWGRSVVYGDGLFVVVGSSVVTSPDGINWTERTGGNGISVTYGNGLYVYVSGGNKFVVSANGVAWTDNQVPTGGWFDITYGNGLFVAVSITDGKVMTSSP